MSHHTLLAVPWKPIVAGGATFDGANDYMLRGGGLTGAADSKQGIFSCWIKLNADSGAQTDILFGGAGVQIVVLNNELFAILIVGAATGLSRFAMSSSPTAIVVGSWTHILASWDVGGASTTESHCYLNDSSAKNTTTFTDEALDYTQTDWSIGASTSGSSKLNADLAEVYFAPGQYLDFSTESNRRKFITATNRPMYLGTDGSTPTGTAPLIYQSILVGAAASGFATNKGTGGDFTITGALASASTSPSG